jgi:hypothetical protein
VLVAKLTAVLNDESDESLDPVHGECAGQAERQHRFGVVLPRHLAVRVDAGQAVQQTLQRPEPSTKEGMLGPVHPRHVPAERLDAAEQDGDDDPELQEGGGCHENHSGFSNATTR